MEDQDGASEVFDHIFEPCHDSEDILNFLTILSLVILIKRIFIKKNGVRCLISVVAIATKIPILGKGSEFGYNDTA